MHIMLAGFVGEPVMIRYDPRNVAEIREESRAPPDLRSARPRGARLPNREPGSAGP
jgi:hypothetical protein